MGFEDYLLNKIDRNRANREELSPLMTRAHEKARAMLDNPDYSIQEEEFKTVYGNASVLQDLGVANRLEQKFKQEETIESKNTKKIAETLEAIMLEQSEQSNWLGNAHTLKASRFDDYVNKVDMIAEWSTAQEGSRILALGVDVTFGTTGVKKKLEAIHAEIMTGKLGTIRYFKDMKGDFMGSRLNVPRAIVGVSAPVVEELAGQWMRGEKKNMGKHPIQHLMIEQLCAQLESMRTFAKSQMKHGVERAYDDTLAILKPLRVQKAQFRDSRLMLDPVAEEISYETRRLFRV